MSLTVFVSEIPYASPELEAIIARFGLRDVVRFFFSIFLAIKKLWTENYSKKQRAAQQKEINYRKEFQTETIVNISFFHIQKHRIGQNVPRQMGTNVE